MIDNIVQERLDKLDPETAAALRKRIEMQELAIESWLTDIPTRLIYKFDANQDVSVKNVLQLVCNKMCVLDANVPTKINLDGTMHTVDANAFKVIKTLVLSQKYINTTLALEASLLAEYMLKHIDELSSEGTCNCISNYTPKSEYGEFIRNTVLDLFLILTLIASLPSEA